MSTAPTSLIPCRHQPMPWSGAYGHWECQLPHGHRGDHRFNNYTWRRSAKFRGGVRYAFACAQLRVGKALRLVRPWRVAIRHTATTYAPDDLLSLYERRRSNA